MATEIIKTWKTKSGKAVTVTGRLITEKVSFADGYNITVPACEIYLNVEVEGHGSMGSWVRELTSAERSQAPGPEYTHKVGKMALTTEQANIIKAVRAELEALPEWQRKQARTAQNEAELTEDYQRRNSHPGWCNKCQSYCYGDCTAS